VSDIVSPRLVMRLVPLAGLQATSEGDREASRRLIGEGLTDEWFDNGWIAAQRLKQWTEDPTYAPWSIRAILLRTTGEVVGSFNCHHGPMDFRIDDGTCVAVEVGYTVFAAYRRRGIGREAVTAYADWAAGLGVDAFVLSISPENEPSLGLAQALGARKIGSQIDEIDGPEDIFFLPLKDLAQAVLP
jgi:ribosomal-protein-alanine N-acetyltransferase